MNILDIELPVVKNRNAQVSLLANRVYHVGSEEIFLSPVDQVDGQVVRVVASILGEEVELFVSLAMVNAILGAGGLKLEEMSPDALALYLLQNREAFAIESMEMVDQPQDISWFRASSYKNNQAMPWYVGVGYNTELAHIVSLVAPFCKGVMPALLAQLPIPLPLVASTLSMQASDLEELQVGDVLLLEGV